MKILQSSYEITEVIQFGFDNSIIGVGKCSEFIANQN